jgi:hypothetical protein
MIRFELAPRRPPFVVNVARLRRASHARIARKQIEEILTARARGGSWAWNAAASRVIDRLLVLEEQGR